MVLNNTKKHSEKNNINEVEEYIQSGGVRCMHCQCDEFCCGTFQSDINYAWQKITCSNCGATWNDVYQLTGVEFLEDPEKSKISKSFIKDKVMTDEIEAQDIEDVDSKVNSTQQYQLHSWDEVVGWVWHKNKTYSCSQEDAEEILTAMNDYRDKGIKAKIIDQDAKVVIKN